MSASALSVRIKRRSRSGDTLLEAANRILRLLGVNTTKRVKQPPLKSKASGRAGSPVRAPIAQAESPASSPLRMQPPSPADRAPAAPAPAPAPRPHADPPAKPSATDYIFGKIIGEGCFSHVCLAKDVKTQKEYAIKICDKSHIIRENKSEYIRREKEALTKLMDVPRGIVKLYCTFQDRERLYFVLSYAKNGELLPYINKVGSFELNVARFYAAELLLALENMHARGIVHRDLKPENILLDDKMHLLVADFGTAKISRATDARARKNSFVGTAQYVSPEILTHTADTRASDLWALGCIVYQMISGLPPFRGATDYLIFRKILNRDFQFPEGFPADARDLVEKLLVVEPTQRLGADDSDVYTSVRSHPFFDGVEWDSLYEQTPPTIYPYLPGNEFEEEHRSNYSVPDHLEPGYGRSQIVRLWNIDLSTSKDILNLSPAERKRRLEAQKEGPWHRFVDGEVILKQGLVDKRKGLFARRRMLLLTTGPRLFYVDPANMVLKGEIPWSSELRVEAKNFRIFFVHTPNRTYYLEDPESYALEWCKVIDEVRIAKYGQDTT